MTKVLIVDDAAFMRMQLRDILTKLKFEIIGEATNGKDAVQQYKNLEPDLITMDITMPVMDGIEAVKQIRNISDTVKIIICSAMGQQSLVMDAIQAGADDFIVKPFSTDRIKEAIKNINIS